MLLKRYPVVLPVMLVFVILVSGCVDWLDEDVVEVIENPEKGMNDVVDIKDINTIPISPVMVDSDISVFFTLKNKDDMEDAREVFVELYNPSIFKCLNKAGELDTSCSPDICRKATPCEAMMPGEEKQIVFSLKAPPEKDVVNLITPIEIDFQVNYDFFNSHTYPVLVVTRNEIESLQRSGEKIEKVLVPISSSGPMQISAELMNQKYITAGRGARIQFLIKDEGSGGVKESRIENGNIKIYFPKSLVAAKGIDPPSTLAECGTPIEGCEEVDKEDYDEYIVYTNPDEIDLFDGKTNPLVFRINNVKGERNIVEHRIKARVDYTYTLRKSIEITVVP